jgi:hypothetical protein
LKKAGLSSTCTTVMSSSDQHQMPRRASELTPACSSVEANSVPVAAAACQAPEQTKKADLHKVRSP